ELGAVANDAKGEVGIPAEEPAWIATTDELALSDARRHKNHESRRLLRSDIGLELLEPVGQKLVDWCHVIARPRVLDEVQVLTPAQLQTRCVLRASLRACRYRWQEPSARHLSEWPPADRSAVTRACPRWRSSPGDTSASYQGGCSAARHWPSTPACRSFPCRAPAC